jgi:crotonobetainyl-CoA:carnitine CoA-transferase CaiB-like acyl-CoA transferase
MNKALDQVTVLDLTTSVSGAFATMLLGDFGATVVKVESPEGDPMRRLGPEINGVHPVFTAYHRNKKSIVLDLEIPGDLQTLKGLLPQFDVLVGDMPAVDMRKYGLDHDSLKEQYPALITVSISAFGEGNSYTDRPAFEETLQAESGLSYTVMDFLDGGAPQNINAPLAETTAGYYTAIPLLAALHAKNVTGLGQHIEVNKCFGLTAMIHFNILGFKFLNMTFVTKNNGAPVGYARCKDSMVYVVSGVDIMWKRTQSMIDDPELNDPKFDSGDCRIEHGDFIMERVEKWLMQYTEKEIYEKFTEAGVPVGFVRNVAELERDPHVSARNQIVKIDVPDVGTLPFFANHIRLADSGMAYGRAPHLGEHTAEFCGVSAK